ncbi:MAG TPA: hypothetical protein VHG09_15510 [Longimicrobiales bacterium]|nr:hypothetical protein [Longimicrobiales bacterium]
MRELFHADGDTWRVSSDAHDSDREVHTVVFHCVSNSQRPYRVVEIPDPVLQDRDVESLKEAELTELFGRSQTMDFSHDEAAEPQSHGYGDPPLH